jgi:hypothetical protein
MLDQGRFPQTPGLRWIRVVLTTHDNGVPKDAMRLAIHAEPEEA